MCVQKYNKLRCLNTNIYFIKRRLVIKLSPNLVNFLVLTSGIKIRILLFFVKVTSNIALKERLFCSDITQHSCSQIFVSRED